LTEGHISRETLGGYLRRELSPAELEQFDRHLSGCEPCRDALLELTPDGSGLLNAVAIEQRRHLSYEQLEALLEQRSEDDLDDLAQQHLSDCEVCQRELADLRAFDAMLSETAPVQQKAAQGLRPPSMWRTLFWPVTGLAGAIAAAVLVMVNTGIIPIGTRAIQMVVTLESPNPDESGQRVRSLTGGATGPALPVGLARQLEDASRLAASTGKPQTIQLTVSATEYQMLSKVIAALGRLESEPAAAPGNTRQRVEVTLTIQPPSVRP
jgi:hypothetical protein